MFSSLVSSGTVVTLFNSGFH